MEGDWTNFLYITTYGNSNFWNASDAYDGGDASNDFNHPEGILATESNVFIADTGNDRIMKLVYKKSVIFTPEPSNIWELSYMTEWGESGTVTGQYQFPNDMVFGLDSNKYIYVVDSGNSRIQWFDINGNWKGAFGSLGAGQNQFDNPKGICVVPENGNFIIADSGNDRIVEYTPDWTYVREMVTIPNYPDPMDVEFDKIFGPYDVLVIASNLYITEAGRDQANQYKAKDRIKGANNANRFILVNYSNFNYIADWNIPESAPGVPLSGFTGNVMQGIRGLIDFDGFLLFATADNSQSQYLIADSLGYIIGKFGTDVISGAVSPSPDEGKFAYPYNLARYSNFVFCADSGNNRVQMWKKNSLPVFDYPKTNYFEVRELQVLSFTVHAKDDDGDYITYSGELDPPGNGRNWGVNSDYLKFSMIPNMGDTGQDFVLTLRASDGIGSATMDVTIHVNPVNANHKNLVKGKPGYFEDWVYDPADDGDLVSIKTAKNAEIIHWDGSRLDVSESSTIAIKTKRAKNLIGTGYDGLYGEIYATNEYALGSVAQLDVVEGDTELKKVSNVGSIGRVKVPKDSAVGTVQIKSGNLGGVDGMTIKSIKTSAGKIKTLDKMVYGGHISGAYYPGQFARIRAYGVDKKGVSVNSISTKGGHITNVWIHGLGHIKKVAAKVGKDELKQPVGGSLQNSIVRAGVDPDSFAMQAEGDVMSVQVSDSIEYSALVGAADPGTGGFDGTAVDPTEQYNGSVNKIKIGKDGIIYESLIVTKEPIKKIEKLNIDPTTKVIVDGVIE